MTVRASSGYFRVSHSRSANPSPLGTAGIGDVTAEGERVWFEAQSFAKLKDGHAYQNAYVFFMRVRHGKIIEYTEFADTYYIYRVIDSPQTRGAPQPRYRIFDTPSRIFRGDALGEALRGHSN